MDKKFLPVIIFVLISGPLFSDGGVSMDIHSVTDVSQLIAAGKGKLVQVALESLERSGQYGNFTEEKFNKASIFYSDTMLWVSFDQTIRFVPLNTAYVYEVTVYLFGQQGTSCTQLNNPNDFFGDMDLSVYEYSSREKADLSKILKILGIDPENMILNTLTIIEKDEYYEIHSENNFGVDVSKLGKEDWRIYDQYSEEFPPAEEKGDRELKE